MMLPDFFANTNEELLRCGLCPLYTHHPFDRIILSCGSNAQPLETFMELHELRYTEI